jgi:RsaL-like HTH domain
MKVSRQSAVQIKAEDLRKYRRSKRESQGLFWSRFGVTQSRGSRFEKGAEIPKPVAILLELYLNGVLTDGDLGVARGAHASAKRPVNVLTSVSAPGQFA